MDNHVDPKSGVAEWFRKLPRKSRPAAVQMNLVATPPGGARDRSSSPELFPGNYYMFDFLIELTVGGVTLLGYPKCAITDTGVLPPVVRWGTPLHLASPDPSIPRVVWIDNPQTGISRRKLPSVEDLLGAEGSLGGTRFRFEQVLHEGKNQVVYSLVNDEKQARIEYGFSRELFDAAPALRGDAGTSG